MKNYLLGFIAFIFTGSVFSQTDSSTTEKKTVPSIATVKTLDGKTIKGWFYKMNNESVYLLPVQRNKKYFRSSEFLLPDINEGGFNIQGSQIKTIALQKKNAGSKGFLIGLGVGVTAGIIIGFNKGDSPGYYQSDAGFFNIYPGGQTGFIPGETAEAKAAKNGVKYGIIGGIAGLIIAKLIKKKFTIGEHKDTYRNQQEKLMKRLIIK
jgi:hypothetical protein